MKTFNDSITLRVKAGSKVDGEIPSKQQTPAQAEDVNCAPGSEVRTGGTPNIATKVKRKALTQDSAVIELNRATSSQCVVLSFLVSRNVKQWLEGTEQDPSERERTVWKDQGGLEQKHEHGSGSCSADNGDRHEPRHPCL